MLKPRTQQMGVDLLLLANRCTCDRASNGALSAALIGTSRGVEAPGADGGGRKGQAAGPLDFASALRRERAARGTQVIIAGIGSCPMRAQLAQGIAPPDTEPWHFWRSAPFN